MNVHELILFMIKSDKRSERKLSLMLSNDATYLRSIIKRHTVPKTDTYARIADVCGYDLLVRRRSDGEEIPIDT